LVSRNSNTQINRSQL